MNEEILEKLSVAETSEDVQMILKEYDIDLSDEEAAKLLAECADGKVSDEALAGVAGGYNLPVKHGGLTGFFSKSDSQGVIGDKSKLTEEQRTQLKPYSPSAGSFACTDHE